MEYRVIRSRRKTIALQLTGEGELLVRAPLRCSETYIRQFVESKRSWIDKHRRQILDRNAGRDGFSLTDGMEISICGESFTVRIVPGLRAAIHRGKGMLVLPSGDMDRVRDSIRALARTYGRPVLLERLEYWAGVMGITFRGLKINAARTRWGSCSAQGNINISLYLLFAPMEAIDYVLVHELAHRRHFDHSPAFWKTVGRYIPDYAARKQTLRRFQREPFLQSLAEE